MNAAEPGADLATLPVRPRAQWLSVDGIGHGISRTTGALLGRRSPVLDRVVIVIIALLVILAVVGQFWTPDGPYTANPVDALRAPSAAHWFGTDDLGRDVFSRVLAGAFATLLVSLFIVAASALIGVLVACAAAVSPRLVDHVIMRICDVFLVVPSLVLALGIAAAIGPSLTSSAVAMVVALWPGTARLMRGILRETMQSSYIEAARTMGMSRWRALMRHGLPNSLDSVIVQATMEVSGVIVLMAGLAYLGAGAPAPSADWGAMIAEGQGYVATAWWMALFPGAAITITSIAFGLLGDSLRDRLDPTLEVVSR